MSSQSTTTTTTTRSIIYLGLDVHKESVTIAVLPAAARAATRVDRLPNDLPKLKRYLDRVARGGASCACAMRRAEPGMCCTGRSGSGGTRAR
jgi:hypothetical protein